MRQDHASCWDIACVGTLGCYARFPRLILHSIQRPGGLPSRDLGSNDMEPRRWRSCPGRVKSKKNTCGSHPLIERHRFRVVCSGRVWQLRKKLRIAGWLSAYTASCYAFTRKTWCRPALHKDGREISLIEPGRTSDPSSDPKRKRFTSSTAERD